jgi:predicted nucleotidyltransferase
MENKVYSLQELKDNIHSLVKDLPVYSVVLFGSYAKGNEDTKSDIDLMIDSKILRIDSCV